VFVNESTRWGDPRRLLLSGKEWEAERSRLCRALEREPTPQAAIAGLAAELDQAFRRTAENMANNPAVRVEQEKGRDTLVLAPLDALPEPPSLVALRTSVQALLPRVDLPDLLLEVAAWTRFPAEFTHASEGRARVDDLATSVCAVLVAEACYVAEPPFEGLGRLPGEGHPSLLQLGPQPLDLIHQPASRCRIDLVLTAEEAEPQGGQLLRGDRLQGHPPLTLSRILSLYTSSGPIMYIMVTTGEFPMSPRYP
jgi:hypothetical protein